MDMAAFMRKRLGSEWKGLYVHHSPVIDNKIIESRRDCAAKNACGTRSKRSHFQPRIRSMLVRFIGEATKALGVSAEPKG